MVLENFQQAPSLGQRQEDPLDNSILKFNSDAPQTIGDSTDYFDDSDFFIRTKKKKAPRVVLNFGP